MIGLGTIINAIAIIIGSLAGLLFKNILNKRYQDALIKVNGLTVIFLGLSGAISKILVLNPQNGNLQVQKTLMMIIALVLGVVVGEIIDIEAGLERFGQWLKHKSGNQEDSQFLNGFLTATFTVCIGAMAIMGALEDGLTGDISILIAKSTIDFVTVMIMAAGLGKGTLFSAIPVLIFQGSITLLASFIQPIMTAHALENISLVGNILISSVGFNLIKSKTFRVANMLPAIVFAVIFALLGFHF